MYKRLLAPHTMQHAPSLPDRILFTSRLIETVLDPPAGMADTKDVSLGRSEEWKSYLATPRRTRGNVVAE